MITTNQIKSSKGFPYQKFIFWVMGIYILILLIVSLYSKEKEAPDLSFFLFLAGNVLIIGFIFSRFFPNTKTVILKDNEIEIISGKNHEMIDLHSISKISTISSIINLNFIFSEYYRIDFHKPTKFGKHVYFSSSNKNIKNSNKSFSELLKIRWLNNM